MAQQKGQGLQNNFSGGLKTEFTGLNFPENSCTSVSNCVFTLQGDVTRRAGIDYESGFTTNLVNRSNLAISTYIWTNVGGDGQTKVYVVQIGSTLYFYQLTNATITNPLSTTLLTSTVNISGFAGSSGVAFNSTIECQFTDGNGYLFVFHPNTDPFYCTFNAGVITANVITMQIRDFAGIPEINVGFNTRPITLTSDHKYNLQNQGWSNAASWTTTAGDFWNMTVGTTQTFHAGTGISAITIGQVCKIDTLSSGPSLPPGTQTETTGTVNSYNSSTGVLTVNITSVNPSTGNGDQGGAAGSTIFSVNTSNINSWFTSQGNYPSNSDIWWYFKDSTGVFNPTSTVPNVVVSSAPAPKGSYILNAFNQDRGGIAGITGITVASTSVRPKTGTWFQGRVWYTGVDASFPAKGDMPFTTWTENIYFSQIITLGTTQFGFCYQQNDPTNDKLFSLLPSDGGVINIQGSGSIYKLVPIQNGLLVFAANGIWFITGGQGIGFTANNYTITKVSNVQSISSTSYINVQGTIFFWNEEGLYTVSTQVQQGQAPLGSSFGGISVQNLCLGTILTYYKGIPLQSKKFVRGDYNPITYVLSWVFKSTNEQSITDRYQFDSVLNLNTRLGCFYPYSITGTTPQIQDIKYVAGPGGSTSPSPTFKYLTSTTTSITFAEERDSTNWVDFISFDNIGVNYTSFFQSGYNPMGQFLTKFQPIYLNVFSKGTNTRYIIQGVFDYVNDPQSGKYSQPEIVEDTGTGFQGIVRRRHRIRGHGYTFQLLVTSVQGQPFDIQGWSTYLTKNMSVA